MSNTIAQLLSKTKIKHKLPPESPILKVTTDLFDENEYADLITIVWLYGEGFIDITTTPGPQRKLGELSKVHVGIYYDSVKKEVGNALRLSKNPVIQPAFIEINVPRRWINPTVVTHFIYSNPTYKGLLNSLVSKELPVAKKPPVPKAPLVTTTDNEFAADLVFRWLASCLITPNQESHLIGILQSDQTGFRDADDKVISILIDELNRHPSLQNLIYKGIIKLNLKLAKKDLNDLAPEVLTYFHEILSALSKKYPATPENLIYSLGLEIPPSLNSRLKYCLKQDLHKIPGLTEKEWPNLLYYMVLFVFSHAKVDRALLQFTSADMVKTADLARIAGDYYEYFDVYHATYLPQYTKKFNEDLAKELDDLTVRPWRISPKALALLCFENCMILKNLFIQTLQVETPNFILGNSIALIPSVNEFALGKAFYCKDKIMRLSNSDALLIEELKEIAHSKSSARPTATSPGSIDDSLIHFKKPTTASSSKAEALNSFFASSKSIDKPDVNLNLQLFAQCLKQVSDETLRSAVTMENIPDYQTSYVLNHEEIIRFLIEWFNKSPVENEVLKQLFYIFPNEKSILHLTEELPIYPGLINLKDIESLATQLDNINMKIRTLEMSFKTLSLSPSSEVSEERITRELQIKWCKFQLDIYAVLGTKLKNKLDEVNVAEEAPSESILSSNSP